MQFGHLFPGFDTFNNQFEFKLTADYMRPFKVAKEALVARFEREYLKRLMARNDNKVARAAREAGIDRKYLYMLLSKHQMDNKNDA